MRNVLVCLLLIACKKEPTMTQDQYEAKNIMLFDGVNGVFAADGTDCTKLAADLDAFITAHENDMNHVVAYEQAHTGAKAAFDAKIGDQKLQEFATKAKAGLAACIDDAKFKAVWDKFTKG
jgi:hypothetical protein